MFRPLLEASRDPLRRPRAVHRHLDGRMRHIETCGVARETSLWPSVPDAGTDELLGLHGTCAIYRYLLDNL